MSVTEWQEASEFVVTYKAIFVVSHINWSVKSIHQVLELMVTWLCVELISLLLEVTDIHEWDGSVDNSHIVKQGSHISES